jgi:hypothetical protein
MRFAGPIDIYAESTSDYCLIVFTALSYSLFYHILAGRIPA